MILNGVLSIAFLPVLLLPPATKLGQGYIFTGVCHSVNRGGGCLLPEEGCLLLGGCLLWGVSAPRGVSAPGWCLLPGGLLPGRSAPRGVSAPGGVPGGDPPPPDGHCWRYASYWNAFWFFHDTDGTSWNDIHVEMIKIKEITTFQFLYKERCFVFICFISFFTLNFLAHLPLSVAILVGVTMLALLPVPNCPYEFAPHAYRSPSSDRAMV